MQTTATYIPLDEAATLLPGSPSYQTVLRWARDGRKIRGHVIRLRAVPGARGELHTTADWVREFVEALSGQTVTVAERVVAGAPVIQLPPTETEIQKRVARARARIARR